jgi:hypoxanthine phosphoribosyltransferase
LERRLLITRQAIDQRIEKLALEISSDYKGKEPVLIGVLNGVVFFIADLARKLSVPLAIDFVRAASYGSEMVSSGTVRLTKDVEIPVQGRQIILVEDIIDTGLTLSHVKGLLQERHPESIKVCALIDKPERREKAVSVDYCGFKIEKGFLVGYGLDQNEKYRNLPDIYVLE